MLLILFILLFFAAVLIVGLFVYFVICIVKYFWDEDKPRR